MQSRRWVPHWWWSLHGSEQFACLPRDALCAAPELTEKNISICSMKSVPGGQVHAPKYSQLRCNDAMLMLYPPGAPSLSRG